MRDKFLVLFEKSGIHAIQVIKTSSRGGAEAVVKHLTERTGGGQIWNLVIIEDKD